MSINNLYYTIREQWKGSGNINIAIIILYTVILYIVFSFFEQNLIGFIFENFQPNKLSNKDVYIKQLEELKINEIIVLIPIICTVSFLTTPALIFKNNSIHRILPISATNRILVLLISIMLLTTISYLTIYILNESLTYYIRYKYLDTLTALQENNGILYKQLDSDSLLSTSFSNRWHEARATVVVFSLSIIINVILFIITLLPTKYSLLKGIIFLIVISIAALNLDKIITTFYQDQGYNYIHINDTNPFNFLSLLIFPSMITGLYYLLKEREA